MKSPADIHSSVKCSITWPDTAGSGCGRYCCWFSALACGGIEQQHLVLAAVVEMIHTATLVHDDVLDEATTRRHVATINSRWTNETSVLLGDYLFTHAFHLASSFGDAAACRMIGRATNIVCEGEMAQVADRGNLALTEEQYFDIIEAKRPSCARSRVI